MSEQPKVVIGVTIENPDAETGRPRMLAQMEVEVSELVAWGIYSDALRTLMTPRVIFDGEAA